MSTIDKPEYVYKRFRVKRADGGSTTVSVDPTLVVKACRELGALQTVSRIVREAALAYDAGPRLAKNRSAHVAATLRAILASKQSTAAEQQSAEVGVSAETAVAADSAGAVESEISAEAIEDIASLPEFQTV